MKYFSIYVHIPFCKKKCSYCNFTSFACEQHEKYFFCLLNEIESHSKKYQTKQVNTVFIGGGTPSAVDAKYITQIISTIKNNYSLTKNCEITIECNPESTTFEKLKAYKNCGINRVSFGVQTLNNKLLKIIGRIHNCSQAITAIKNAKKAGFKNINADVMLGLPTQTKVMAQSTIKKLVELGINHISLYTLILEENTPLFNSVKNNQLTLPTEDEVVKVFKSCALYLKKQGFIRYEVANFSKNNKECKHNKGYWQNADYVGFGVSAHSKVNNVRFSNTENLKQYAENKNTVQSEVLSKTQIREEKIMLGLRTNKGICLNLVKNKVKELKILKQNKFIDIKNNKVIATQKGFFVLNQIILMLI